MPIWPSQHRTPRLWRETCKQTFALGGVPASEINRSTEERVRYLSCGSRTESFPYARAVCVPNAAGATGTLITQVSYKNGEQSDGRTKVFTWSTYSLPFQKETCWLPVTLLCLQTPATYTDNPGLFGQHMQQEVRRSQSEVLELFQKTIESCKAIQKSRVTFHSTLSYKAGSQTEREREEYFRWSQAWRPRKPALQDPCWTRVKFPHELVRVAADGLSWGTGEGNGNTPAAGSHPERCWCFKGRALNHSFQKSHRYFRQR